MRREYSFKIEALLFRGDTKKATRSYAWTIGRSKPVAKCAGKLPAQTLFSLPKLCRSKSDRKFFTRWSGQTPRERDEFRHFVSVISLASLRSIGAA